MEPTHEDSISTDEIRERIAAPDHEEAETRAEEKAEGKFRNKIDNGSAYDVSEVGSIVELNDDWSDSHEDWGHDFLVRAEVEGVEAVGDRAALTVMEAVVPYIADDESMFTIENRPDDPTGIKRDESHAARSAVWTAESEFCETGTRVELKLAGSLGLCSAEFDALRERANDALGDEWTSVDAAESTEVEA